jgi:hypothetical protein
VSEEGVRFVRNTLIKQLEEGSVMLPDGENGELVEVPLSKLGISHPVVITRNPIRSISYDSTADSPEAATANMNMRMQAEMQPEVARAPVIGPGGRKEELPPLPDPPWKLRRYDFIVQFAWKPTPKTERKNGKPADDASLDDTASVNP